MAARTSVGMQLLNGDKLIKQLEALSQQVRDVVAKDAISAAMVPVEQSVIANTPESSTTGSRAKQSSRTRQKWSGSKKLKSTIRSVTRTRKRAGITAGQMGMVGPSYSDGGGHGNLFSKDHKRKVFWGRDAGTIRVQNQFVKRAADQSKARASAVLTQALTTGINQAARATSG